ncbi:MAG: adenylate/guanylate cyclase domain-containing protein [Myxococcota bacterium]
MKRKPSDRKAYLAALCRTVPYTVVEAVLDNPTEAAIPMRVPFQGTVLFADLVGFTALCERMAQSGPEGLSRLTEVLNSLFTRFLEDAVFPFDGHVIQFGGDSLTAVFRGEDHGWRAAAAALTAQRFMREGLPALMPASERDLFLRVGLASGAARLLTVGDVTYRSLVCGGDTSHRALVLQRLAEPGQVVMDDALRTLLGERAIWSPARDGNAVLGELRSWPARVPIRPLGNRIDEQVEEKIALLEPFVAAPLAARLATAPMGWRLDGELRDVVVLFAEICGIDDVADDESQAWLQNFARSFVRVFRKYTGLPAKVDLTERGHRVMVLFGLHSPSDNDPERALLAALEATTRLRAFAFGGMQKLSISVGLHGGKVYFGTFGSNYRHDITVVGDAVNTAARVSAAAGPFEVYATEEIVDASDGEFRTSARPGIVVKGKSAPLNMHLVHSTAERRSHYVRARNHRRFYAGREAVVERLSQLVDAARAGEASSGGLCGEAGSGKSALLSFFIDEWTRKGGVGLFGRCRYATRSSPLAPILGMLSSSLGLASRDTPQERDERIRAGLEPLGLGEGARDLMALLQPVEHPDGARDHLVDLADPHTRDRLLDAVLGVFEKTASDEPMLYVLEDLHHADSLTLELAVRMANATREGPNFLMATYRPDTVVNAYRRVARPEVELRPLDREAMDALVRHEVGAHAVDARLMDFLVRRTGGNPGYLVEILRFLRERALLTVRAGVATAPAADATVLHEIVPSSLTRVALARLDNLGEVERRLLRTASAAGQRFPRELMERVFRAEMDLTQLYAAMENLEGERVISSEGGDGRGYAFRDEVTRAVAYGTIPEANRKDVHRRIADALEQLPESEPARSPASLAIHRERAAQYPEAAQWYERAARVALAAGLDDEACQLIGHWETCVTQMHGEQRPPRAQQARMALMKLVATGRRGVPAETMRQGREVVAQWWNDLDDDERRMADRWLGEALLWLGRPARARERLQRVYESAVDAGLRADAAILLARSHEFAGERAQAEQWLDRAALLNPADAYRAARVELTRANLKVLPDELQTAHAMYLGVREMARARRHLRLDAAATGGLAYAALRLGRCEEAARGFTEAMNLFRALGSDADVANHMVNLGQAHLWAQRPDEALPHLETALPLATEIEDGMSAAEARIHLGAALALTRDPVLGRRLLEEGAAQAAEMDWREPVVAATLHQLHLAIIRLDPDETGRCRAFLHNAGTEMGTPLFRGVLEHLVRRAREAGLVTT